MDPTERRQRVSEEAAEWWVRLRADDLPREEREQFVDWLRESHVHVAEMLRVAQVHGALEQFQRWARIATDGGGEETHVVPLPVAGGAGVQRTLAPQSSARRGHRTLWLGAMAASIGAVAIAVVWFVGDFGSKTIHTERGERREVALADGSVLQVGPETRLRVRFEATERRVILDRGATLFRVAKDSRRPFIVQADEIVVRAVGTAFGVERRDEGIVVTVAEGRVEVGSVATAGATPVVGADERTVREKEQTVSQSSNTLTLVAGEQVAVPRKGDVGSVRKVDSGRELAWAQGRLVFENDAVADIIQEFNRYNRVQLHVTDDTLARRPISGVFDASDPESFIAFVESVAPVRIIRGNGQTITLAPTDGAATDLATH